MPQTIRVRFEYEIVTDKDCDFAPGDFAKCESLEALMQELADQCPAVEWSVYPNEGDAAELWEAIQAERR